MNQKQKQDGGTLRQRSEDPEEDTQAADPMLLALNTLVGIDQVSG